MTSKKMEKRVYGVVGIRSVMANWNADFSGRPKTISTGDVFGSDKALKYPVKQYFKGQGQAVLYTKTFKYTEGKKGDGVLGVRSLKERYEQLFQVEDLKKEKDSKVLLENLFSAVDVKNFGATFAEEGNNISITGAVQIGQGFNKFKDSEVETQQILSPFRNPNETKDNKERNQASLGTKIISDEAHYVYPFVINPSSYDNYVEMGVTEGYTEADYENLKEALLLAASAYSTNAKMGCDNELAVFVETDADLYLPDLAQFVDFRKEDGKNIYRLGFDKVLQDLMDRIKAIEIYYNDFDMVVEHDLMGEKVKTFNIFTKEEI